MSFDVWCVQTDPAFPPVDCRSGRPGTLLRLVRIVINAVADHFLSVMFERHHGVWKHTMYLPISGIVAFVPWKEDRFPFTVIMTDETLTIIPEDERTFFAHRTKIFTAVR